jgi:fibronectin-binding autotransporter adhesin
MSAISLKKILRNGTAIVAATLLSTQAYAGAEPVTLDGTLADDTWAETAAGAGTQTGLPTEAQAGDGPVSLAGDQLLITNDQMANDGEGLNTFTTGTINNNAGGGEINISQSALGTTGIFSVTIGSVTNGGGGASSMIINTNSAAGQSVAVLDNSVLTLGTGGMTLTNNGSSSGATEQLSLTVEGVTSVAGQLLATAGGGVNDSVTITDNDDATYSSAAGIGLRGGTAAGADTELVLNGATNTLTGLVSLQEPSTGQAILYLGANVTSLTATAGIIGGVGGNQGEIYVNGSTVITGSIGAGSAVKAITVGLAGTTSSITGTVNAEAVLIDGGGDGTAGAMTFGSTVTARALEVISEGTTTAQAETATITGNASVAGATLVTAGSFTGANATLNLNGASNTLTGAVTLTDVGDGPSGAQAILNFGPGVTSTTVTAGINGGAANEGVVNLQGSNTIIGSIGATTGVYAVTAGVENTTSSITGAVNAYNVTVSGGTNAAHTGAVTFGSTLAVGAGSMTVSSAGTTMAQVENTTVTGAFTDAGVLNVTAGAEAGANASLTLNGATNTIVGATTLTDVAAGGNSTLAIGNGATVNFEGGLLGASTNEGTLALAGSATINGAVGSVSDELKAITLAGAGTDEFAGNFYATTIAYGASNSTLEIADGANITSTITATNTGTLTFLGSSTVGGQIGAAVDVVSTINAGQTTGSADTFNNAVYAANLNVGAGSATFKGATSGALAFTNAAGTATLDGVTFTGNINGTGGTTVTGVGNLVLEGTNTITGNIGNTGTLNTLTLEGVGVTDTVTSGGLAINAANTTNVGTNTLALGTNNFTVGAGQNLAVTISSGAAHGEVTSVGAVSVNAASKLDLTINGYFPTTTFTLVTGGSGVVSALNAGGLTVNGVNDGTATSMTLGAVTYAQVGAGTDELEIQATNNGSASVASNPNNLSVARAMDTIGTTGNAAIQGAQGNIYSASSSSGVNSVLSSLLPTVDGGSQMASIQVMTQIQDITDTRMAAVEAGDGSSGVAAGATDNGVGMWIQGYGESANQQERDSVAGYHASTWGSAIGADSENIIDNGLLGVAVNYGKATVDSDNTNETSTIVDNYGLTFYGVAGFQNQTFLEGQTGFAYNKISSTRNNVGGVAGDDADGSTHSDQYDAKMTFGQDFARWFLADVTATPDISASYTHLNTQGYTETGTGADLNVGSNSQNNFNVGFGGKLAYRFRDADGSVIKPIFRADYSYAILDDRIDTTSNFVGASAGTNPSFVTEGAQPDRNRLDLSAGVTYMSTANWDMSANYNFEYRPDYKANTGTLRATAHF